MYLDLRHKFRSIRQTNKRGTREYARIDMRKLRMTVKQLLRV